MMNKKEKIEQEINKTLELMENEKELKPNPYFYSKLIARIESEKRNSVSIFGYLKPIMLTLLLLFNVLTIAWEINLSTESKDIDSKEELVSLLKEDLSMSNSTLSIFY